MIAGPSRPEAAAGSNPEDAAGGRARRSCPICGRETLPDHRPFCSRRCADVDLHRWLSGAYAIAGSDEDVGNEEGDAAEAGDGADGGA